MNPGLVFGHVVVRNDLACGDETLAAERLPVRRVGEPDNSAEAAISFIQKMLMSGQVIIVERSVLVAERAHFSMIIPG